MRSMEGKRMKIVMLPYVSHGHISPYLEFAKQLSKRNCFNIYICSTPINLASIKNRVDDGKDDDVRLVELHLPSSEELPPHFHSSNGLPSHLKPNLHRALEMAAPGFTEILKTINPDLVIYDFQPTWPAQVALSLNIPAVFFATTAAANFCLFLFFCKNPDEDSPFPEIYVRNSENPPTERSHPVIRNMVLCFERSTDLVLVKSCREVEGKYIDHLSSVLATKKVIPVGPLVEEDPTEAVEDDKKINEIIKWLDKKNESSVVFVCFGSENYLFGEQVTEMANALESSKCNFIWAVRSPKGEQKGSSSLQLLPQGFVERVGDMGLVIEGWAPQKMILRHSSTGGFLSHCGWNSMNESIKYGVPIIGMPITGDQPSNARIAVATGFGMQIVRNIAEGIYKKDEICDVIRKVMVDESGQSVRKKAKELSLKIEEKGDEYIDKAVEALLQIFRKNKETNQL
uniref:Glycosyltransferase n=1 Tax=Bupleurum chinense TaxID=52451 RepID=I3VI31_BUPCH|nr:glycosyltransferase UGT5 [Bupleurum chinense]